MNEKQIRLAIAPIGWSNDDMPDLGAHIPFEQCIREMAEAGYEGCEVGHKFPRDPVQLSAALAPHGLSVASAWFSTYFTEPERAGRIIADFISHMKFLKAMGAKVIVVCECGRSVQGEAKSVFDDKPRFTEREWEQLIAGLTHLGRLAKKQDMTIVYHHHMGTGISEAGEIDRLLAATDPRLVSLLLDTGHLTFTGEDPLAVLRLHGERIRHVHLKDIRRDVLAAVREERLSFLEAVRAGVFTVPGDGCIDFKPILGGIQALNYQGWWVVEAEQDPDQANPLEYAVMARKFLLDQVGF